MTNSKQKRDIAWFWYFMIMVIVFLAGTLPSEAQIKNIFKYSTIYTAKNGGTSLSDNQVWSVTSGALTPLRKCSR